VREAALLAALPAQVRPRSATPRLCRSLAGVDAAAVTTRAALAALPVTRKGELLERQKAHARRRAGTRSAASRPSAGARWAARRARACSSRPARSTSPKAPAPTTGAGARDVRRRLRAGDLVHNSFSYHLTPGAWIMESGAHALGCTVFPGGVGNTELQLQAMAELRPTPTPARPASCASCWRRRPRPAWRCRT
jgi:phenylacetate-CoA ligase